MIVRSTLPAESSPISRPASSRRSGIRDLTLTVHIDSGCHEAVDAVDVAKRDQEHGERRLERAACCACSIASLTITAGSSNQPWTAMRLSSGSRVPSTGRTP